MSKPILNIKSFFRNSVILLFPLIILVAGCKDTGGSVSPAAILEDCYSYMNASDWENAATTCMTLETDEGRHLTAQAYMNLAGLSMTEMLSNSSSDPSELLSGSVPDTQEKADNLRAALNKLMGEILEKDSLIYMESIIVSSLLIYREINQVASIFTAPTITMEFDASWGEDLPKYLTFGGLDPSDATADFYQDLCGSLENTVDVTDSTHDGESTLSIDITDPITATIELTYDVTVDSCIISETSPLYYNKLANEGYEAAGNEAMEGMNFYDQLDSGENFSADLGYTGAENVTFCKPGKIEPPDATDDALNDCEILGALTSMGISL